MDNSYSEYDKLQSLPAVNESRPLSEIKAGDVVRVIPIKSFCSAGNERVKEVSEDAIVLESGTRWDRKTGASKQPPWAYHL